MIAIVNNAAAAGGAQPATAKLIAWFRRRNVPIQVFEPAWAPYVARCGRFAGIVLSGSDLRLADAMPDAEVGRVLAALLGCRKPVLGICYGHQLLAHLEGGTVAPLPAHRSGAVAIETRDPIVPSGVYRRWHHDAVVAAPPGWEVLAQGADGVIEAMRHRERPWRGVQFHPELSGAAGDALLQNFVAST